MSKSIPFFSIIVPIYNSERSLERCIKSILNQTIADFELILVNDGSIDNSGLICEEYKSKDPRIKVFHKKNGGASSARNFGLDNAIGKWVTFSDSDDWVYPMWLQNFKDNIEGVEMVCQGMRFDFSYNKNHVEQEEDRGVSYVGTASNFLDVLYNGGIVGYTVIKCFLLSLIKIHNIRFDERFNLHEDEEFVLRYLKYCYNIRSVRKIGYYYYVPDFANKYTIKNPFFLFVSLYNSSKEITLNHNSRYSQWARLKIIEYIADEFSKGTFRSSRALLLTYRKHIGKDILYTPMFALTKFAIYLDVTAIFSTLIYFIHIKLKSLSN